MRHLITPLLAAVASVLSTAPASADIGDQLFKLLPDDGATDDQFGVTVAISGATAIYAYNTVNVIYTSNASVIQVSFTKLTTIII